MRFTKKEKEYIHAMADTYERDGESSLLTQEEFNILMNKLKQI